MKSFAPNPQPTAASDPLQLRDNLIAIARDLSRDLAGYLVEDADCEALDANTTAPAAGYGTKDLRRRESSADEPSVRDDRGIGRKSVLHGHQAGVVIDEDQDGAGLIARRRGLGSDALGAVKQLECRFGLHVMDQAGFP
jgi:hypothetical protein